MAKLSLPKAVNILLLTVLTVVILFYGKSFLVPVAFAGILSMLFIPISRRLEKKGLKRGLASLLCVLMVLVAIAAFVFLIGWQISNFAEDATQMEQRITKMFDQLRQTVSNTFGISPEKQQEMIKKQQEQGGGGGIGQAITGLISSISGMLVNTVLVLVYIFLFLFFRLHLKKFVLQLVPADQKENTGKVLEQITKVAYHYLAGLAMMIVVLWIMYGIGFSIVGVKNAIFFAILCGVLEIIPFVGNLLGNGITILMAITQGGGSAMVIGIIITYAIVQFLQTYILEPLVVGAEVNINPLFTILVLVAGEQLWGVAGMVLAIPILGVTKIICDNVDALKPIGFLIGQEKKEKKNDLKDKIKGWFK
jgi:predicted PurR-regulated permease PerM